jgi:hypothetical protein
MCCRKNLLLRTHWKLLHNISSPFIAQIVFFCIFAYHVITSNPKTLAWKIMQIDSSLIKHHHAFEMLATWVGFVMLLVKCKQEPTRMFTTVFESYFANLLEWLWEVCQRESEREKFKPRNHKWHIKPHELLFCASLFYPTRFRATLFSAIWLPQIFWYRKCFQLNKRLA